MHRSTRSLLAVVSMACGLGSTALADCNVYRLDIPDFDQRREAGAGILGLPNNGSVHCAPTSAMNWLAYITNHGYPEVLGGVRDWQANSNYNDVTSLINWLGVMMNTTTGTQASDHAAGLEEWLEMTSPGNFTVALHQPSGGTYAPSPEEIYELMSAGALVTVCTSGWTFYPATVAFVDGQLIPLPDRFVRAGGGHCVSIARITDGCSSLPRVWFRDPAGFDGPDKMSQGQFVTQYLDAEPLTANFAATDTSQPINRTMYRFVDDNPDKNSIINSLVVVMPMGGLSADSHQGTISVINQRRADDFAPMPTQTYNVPGNAPILGMKYLPHLGAAAVLAKSGAELGTLHRFRPGTGEFTPIATINRPGDIAVGLAGEVYVASTGHAGGVNVCFGDGSVRFIGTGVSGPVALAYDDAANRLGMIFADRHSIATMSIDPSTGDSSGYIERPLPPNLVLAGKVLFAFDPAFRGGVHVASGDVNGDGVSQLTETPNGWTLSPNRINIAAPQSLQVDGRGHVYCESNGVVMESTRSSGGVWRTTNFDTARPLAGNDLFQLTIGRIGRDELRPANQAAIDDPADFPGGTPECRADFNNSGAVSIQDLFDFLAKYFAGSPAADFNASGGLSVQDLFDFLAAYFRGC